MSTTDALELAWAAHRETEQKQRSGRRAQRCIRVRDEMMGQVEGIAYVTNALFGRSELWAVYVNAPLDGIGEPSYPALFCVAGVATVYACTLGHTALAAKEPMSRDEALATAPELVRQAEESWERAP